MTGMVDDGYKVRSPPSFSTVLVFLSQVYLLASDFSGTSVKRPVIARDDS